MLDLKKAGIVTSVRGTGGRLSPCAAARGDHFGEVIRVLDGPIALVPCASVISIPKAATATMRKPARFAVSCWWCATKAPASLKAPALADAAGQKSRRSDEPFRDYEPVELLYPFPIGY